MPSRASSKGRYIAEESGDVAGRVRVESRPKVLSQDTSWLVPVRQKRRQYRYSNACPGGQATDRLRSPDRQASGRSVR
jgi:hypothetical protein